MPSINWFGTTVERSSLGYHMIAPTLWADVEAPIIAARPSGLKIVGDGNEFAMFGNYYNKLKDKTLFIARAFTPSELFNQGISYGVPWQTVARDWHDAVLPLVHHLPMAYWEIGNEPAKELSAYIGLAVAECIRLASASGFRVIAPHWSEGSPRMDRWGDPVDDWLAFMPALEAINTVGPAGALLGIHEYCREIDGGFLTQLWRVGRINGVYEDYIDPAGLNNVYTVVTEYGRDNHKWQELGISAEQYASELTDPTVQALYDPRVVARLIYTLDRSLSWTKMDIHGSCFNLVNSYIAAHQPSVYPPMPGAPVPPQPPPPPPPPAGVKRTTTTLRLRTGPGTGYKIMANMPGGTEVEIIEVLSGWARVNVSLNVWELAQVTDPDDYQSWLKQVRALMGWCSTAYLV